MKLSTGRNFQVWNPKLHRASPSPLTHFFLSRRSRSGDNMTLSSSLSICSRIFDDKVLDFILYLLQDFLFHLLLFLIFARNLFVCLWSDGIHVSWVFLFADLQASTPTNSAKKSLQSWCNGRDYAFTSSIDNWFGWFSSQIFFFLFSSPDSNLCIRLRFWRRNIE